MCPSHKKTPGKRLALRLDERQLFKKFLKDSVEGGCVGVFAFRITMDGKPEFFTRGDQQVVGYTLRKIADGLLRRGLQEDGTMHTPWYRRALAALRRRWKRAVAIARARIALAKGSDAGAGL